MCSDKQTWRLGEFYLQNDSSVLLKFARQTSELVLNGICILLQDRAEK